MQRGGLKVKIRVECDPLKKDKDGLLKKQNKWYSRSQKVKNWIR